ncbi:hypothetical protein AUJ84_03240 [Candidatus Pacearchaeota archaeon CG1_02_32_132]|nr:MAG: hypothetical protein AUJ84_03240 [Candidatus Pacearchaeota archaeon CG1_02_32_132]
MGSVIKRDGKKQTFMPGKIRKAVDLSAKDAGLNPGKRKELIRDVAEPVIRHYKNKRVRASVLRKSLIGRLDRRAKSVSAAWRRHDRKKRK